MYRVLRSASSVSIVAGLLIAACGGTVAVDDEPSGAPGAGGSGASAPTPTTGSGPNPAGTGGASGTSTATGTTGTGGSVSAAACVAACESIQACAVGDCIGACVATPTTCAPERDAYLTCIATGLQSGCQTSAGCFGPLQDWWACESLCPNGIGWLGTEEENGACTAVLNRDCGFSTNHEVRCQPDGPGSSSYSCECLENEQTVGKCTEDLGAACDPIFGCCAAAFFVPG